MRAIFISDLHLSERDPITQSRFDAFMQFAAPGADALYVIGDLLHVWLGDAMLASDAYALAITRQFRALSQSGTRIFIARGNRDFMIGREFTDAAGATLLAAETVLDLGGRRVLLLHGDELCTDDVRYQRARRVLRTDAFRIIGNSLPRFMRNAIARTLRRESDSHKARTAMVIMDANTDAASAAVTRAKATTLIHGHTHRPAHHVLPDGRDRWVLSDWQQDFGYLEWQDGDFSVHPWPTAADASASEPQRP
jgi:UDP-2,3-diacylglucosamine hydrolase